MADRVLLTGISGFLGSHLALQLLARGYVVRGSVRDLARADKVQATLAANGADTARLEFIALDLSSDANWDAAMEGVRYLQHVASPFVTKMPDDRNELIRPAVEGTRRALEAALRAKVERLVVTSSMAAIAYGHDPRRTAPFTAADWTDLDGRRVNAYVESKTRAEREAWRIVERAGRQADLAVVNPSAILGPLLDEDPGTSAALILRLLRGAIPAAPRLSFSIVDVRDVAAIHVAAMEKPEAGGRRFPTAERPCTILELCRILAAAVPERAGKLPRRELPDWFVRLYALFDRDLRGNLGELGVSKRIDPSEAVALLGRPFISAEEATAATARSLLAHHLA